MIPVREFASADEMQAHYKAVRSRLSRGRVAPKAVIAPPPVEVEPVTSCPGPSLEVLLLNFRQVHLVDAPDEHPKVRLIGERREARRLVNLVARRHGIRTSDIMGHSRQTALLAARREAVALVAERFPNWSLPVLGRFFDRDHTTILEALRKAGVRT